MRETPFHLFWTSASALLSSFSPTYLTGAFSFKQILGLPKFLDLLFQARRGYKPRLPGLGGPKSD